MVLALRDNGVAGSADHRPRAMKPRKAPDNWNTGAVD
jgi:hypothetical protein